MISESNIMAIMPKIRQMAYWFARNFGRDADDLFAIGMVGVCEAATKEVSGEPGGFLYRAARYRVINEIRRERVPTLSLDVPIDVDRGLLLADVLSSSAPITMPPEKRIRALYDAVQRLAPRQQQVIVRRYGLDQDGKSLCCGDVAKELGIKPPAVTTATRYALANLAKDASLCALMEVAK